MSLGINDKLYYNTATFVSPTWSEITGVSDLTDKASADKGEGSTRATPVKMQEPTQLDLGVVGKIKDDGGTPFGALATAFFGRSLVDIMVLNGPSTTNGVVGVRYEAKVFDWTEEQGLNGVNFRAFELAPCMSSNPPKTVLVTTGAPVFSTIA